MSKSTYIFNKTTEVNPIDRNNIFIEVNYDNEAIINQTFPQVGIKNLRFAREDVNLFYNWMKSSSEGVFYAPYFDINLSKNSKQYTVPLYLDLTDGFEYSNDGVEASVKLYMSLDWLNDVIDAFTFESIMTAQEVGFKLPNAIASANIINSRTFYIPYVISTVPNYIQAFTGLMTIFSIVYMVEKEIATLLGQIAQIAGVFTTVPGIIGFVAEIAYVIVLVAAMVVAVEGFVFSIIQPVKYHAAMMMADLLEAAAVNMGLEFESSIFQTAPYNRLALLPEKYIPVNLGSSQNSTFNGVFSTYLNQNFIVGGYTKPNPAQQQGYPIMTGGDLARLAKKICNGKILLQNPDTNPAVTKPTLVMERRDYVPELPVYQLPDVRADWNGFNTKEFNSTVIIKFTKDLNDKNTFDYYEGEILSAITQPINQPDPLLVLTKGLREIEIEAARGIRKEDLTFPEKLIGGFISVLNSTINFLVIAPINDAIAACNAIISLINKITKVIDDLFGASIPSIPNIPSIPTLSTANPYNNRIGMLLMEHDLVNVPKLLLMEHTFDEMPTLSGNDTADGSTQRYSNLDPLNSCVVNALYLWNQFYLIDNWVPYNYGDDYALPAYQNQQATSGIGSNWSTTPGPDYGTFSRPPGGDMERHNQFTLWSPAKNKSSDKNKVSLSYDEFILLANNNTFNDMDGDPCIVDSLGWHFEQGWMDLQYRKNEIYDTNLITVVTLPNGQ